MFNHYAAFVIQRAPMTRNDIDNGRLAVEIGVAPLRAAEFVIFRMGQVAIIAQR